jgi:hypothetical protein
MAIGSKWKPSVGREIQDITDKINELITAVNMPSTTEGGTKESQNISFVKKADGKYAVQFRTKDGIIESDNSETTGFKIL